MIDPVRGVAAGLAASAKEMVVAPAPEAGEVSVTQLAPLLAVQGQEEFEAFRAKLPVAAGAVNDAPTDGNENEQLVAAWTTVCNLSPMVIADVRETGFALAATR